MTDIKIEDVNQLLSGIFCYNKQNGEYKILKSTKGIIDLYSILNKPDTGLDTRINILKCLKNSFSCVRHYTVVFTQYFIITESNEKFSLFSILLHLYVKSCDEEFEDSSLDKKEYIDLILEVVNLLISHVTCPIEVFEYVFSLFKPYIYKTVSSETKPLTTRRFLKYFALLSIIYGGKVIKKNPFNYFYLSGEGEILLPFAESGKVDQNIIFFNRQFAIFTWFKIGINQDDFQLYFNQTQRSLIEIILQNNNIINIEVDAENCLRSSTDLALSVPLQDNVWYNLVFAIKPTVNGIEAEIYLNEERISSKKIKLIKHSIKSISLFKNHFGEVSSILFVEGNQYRELFKVFNTSGLRYGIKSEKDFIILSKSLKSNAFENYQSNFIQNLNRFTLNNSHNTEIRLIYFPSRHEIESDTLITLKDTLIDGKLSMTNGSINGVNIHHRYFKNISQVKGLYNLLPLAELIGVSHLDNNPYPLLNNILTNDVLDEYSMLLITIIGNLPKNRPLKEPIYFFQFLSLFLERLPTHCFTFNVYNYLRTLLVSDDIIIMKNHQKTSLINEIIVRILLNEKIIFKFDLEIQQKIWQTLDIHYANTKIGSSFDMLKIASMLLEMDKERYNKFCCSEHASAFSNTDINQTYEIRSKFKAIANVIMIILKQKPEDIVIFYSLLTKEISPCLQLFIVNWLSSFLIDKKTRAQLNEKVIYDKLMKDNFLVETTMFALSVASFDVRVEIIYLIKLISSWDTKIQFNYQQICFIQAHLIPTDIIIEKEKIINDTSLEVPGEDNIKNTPQKQSIPQDSNPTKSNKLNDTEIEGISVEEDLKMTSGELKNESKESKLLSSKETDENNPKNESIRIDPEYKTEDLNINKDNLEKKVNQCLESLKEDKEMKPIDKEANKKQDENKDKEENITINQNEELSEETKKEKEEPKIKNKIEDDIAEKEKSDKEDELNKKLINEPREHSEKSNDQIGNSITSKNQFKKKQPQDYKIIYLNQNQEYLSKYLNQDKLDEYSKRMFADLLSWFTNSNSTSFVLHCLIKLCPYCDISSSITLIEILNNSEIDLFDIIIKVKPFYNWLLETTFQAYLIKDPNLKGELKFASYYENDSQRQAQLDNLINKAIILHTKICMRNMFKLDYFLQWCTYYKELYQHDNNYSQRLDQFIRFIFDELSIEITSKIVNLAEEKNEMHKSFLYFFSIVFEYFTVFKIGDNFTAEKPTNDKCIINIPEYYSLIFDHTFDDSNKVIHKKWINYTLCKIICDKCFMIWRDKFHLDSGKIIIKNFLNNSNTFITQLNILTMDNWGSQECVTNKGIPLIFILSNLISTIINEIEIESDLDIWLSNYKDFMIFIMLSSSNVNPQDAKYKHIQLLVKEALAFGISFLIHQLNKKKGALFDRIFQTIKELLSVIFSITQQISQDEERDSSRNRDSIWNKIKNQKNVGAKTDCAVYELFNNITRIIGEKIVKNIFSSDKALMDKFTNPIFKQSLTENPSLWLIVDHVFIHNTIFNGRKDRIDKVIPIYQSYCNTNNPLDRSTMILDKNTVDSAYIAIKSKLIKNINFHRNKFNDQYELYVRKNKFEKQQLARKYIKIKHKLFLFRGFWSRKELFFDQRDKLKYRMLDHLTRDYTKPLLYPVIDYDYHLPKFSNFQKENLFIDKVTPQNLIDLDICKYFNNKLQIDKGDKRSNRLQDNNILKRMHDGVFKGIIDGNETDKKYVGKPIDIKYFLDFIDSQMIKSEMTRHYRNDPIPCCMVKPAYHIKGYFFNDSKRVGFFAYNWPNNPKIDFYDKERHTCFGSIFRTQIKKKENYFISIPYKKMERIFKRKYMHKNNSIEIYSIIKKSYFFLFSSQDKRDKVMFNITKNISYVNISIEYRQFNKEVGCENTSHELFNCKDSTDSVGLLKKYEQWIKWEVPTIEMLMYVNILANRSYCDIIQYPVFPWIITDYAAEDITKVTLRDFTQPVGMLEVFPESVSRKASYISNYKYTLQKKEIPYAFGTHYSNPMYTGYYLMRLFPFSQIKLEMQGYNFDNPNRLFNNLQKSFYCSMIQKGDVREIIPEFFYLPEMFININNLDFGEIEDKDNNELIRIQSVELPQWCQNNSYKFIELHLKKLESPEVSALISSWIDIIFGTHQRGEKAVELYNIFLDLSYETYEDIFKQLSLSDKEHASRMQEFGVTPHQVFSTKAQKRKNFEEIYSTNPLTTSEFNASKRKINYNNKEKPKIAYNFIKGINNDERLLIYSFNKVTMLRLLEKSNEIEKKDKKIYTYEQFVTYDIKEENSKISLCNLKDITPIAIYNKGECFIKGGYINGQLFAQYTNGKETKTKYYIQKDMSPITVLTIDQDEKFILCGTKSGLVHIYFISQKESPIDLILHKTLHDHRNSITALHINNRLNVFVTVSTDDYIMMYTMPHCKLFNLIKLPTNSYVNFVFVSSSPLPSIVYYNKTEMVWNCYSINGHQLISPQKTDSVVQAKIYTDLTFFDYIIYSTETKSIVLLELPYLTEINRKENCFDNIIDFDITNDKLACVILNTDKEDDIISIIKHKID